MDAKGVSAHCGDMKPIYFSMAAAIAATWALAAGMASAQQPADDDANWLDAPQTPGDWSYRAIAGGTQATFAAGTANEFTMQCQLQPRAIVLARPGHSDTDLLVRVRTETQDRILQAKPSTAGAPQVTVQLPVRDSLLDTMAITKGRFAIEVEGMVPLYIPAWAEVTRAIEDCR